MTDEQQKVNLINGISNGIGEATASEFAKLGYKVAFIERDQARLIKVVQSLIEVSPNKKALRADFGFVDQVELLVEKVIIKFGRLDVLINNADYSGKKCSLGDKDFYDDFKIMQVDLMAATRLAQSATPHLLKSKGVVINVSSIADRVATTNISYSVSKAGATMFTNCLTNSLCGTGVRAVTVSPGPIKTNLGQSESTVEPAILQVLGHNFVKYVPLERMGEYKEVTDTIVFLASDKASLINGWIDVDGGMISKFGVLAQFAKPLKAPE